MPATGPKPPASKAFGVTYVSSLWNKSSTEIDTAYLYTRDKNSKKIVKILLEESAPDSSLFSGQFTVNWDADRAVAPEVYLPPQDLRGDAQGMDRFNKMIADNTVKPQPLLIRQEGHQQVLEVFDSEELAARARDGSTIGPAADFYEGLIFFAEDNLEKSQASFERVLDRSKDPALDKRAEEYIEKIAQLLPFRKTAAQKIFVNASLGLQYDSNILQILDNDTVVSQVYDKGDARWTFSGDASYRFFFTEKSDFAAKAAINNTQSVSTDFVQADPLTMTFTAPYNKKGLWKGKGYKLGATPGYEMLNMDIDRTGEVLNILNSMEVTTDLMLVMHDKWFSTTTLKLRMDDSSIEGTEDTTTDADAVKTSLKKSEMIFADETKKKAFIPSIGYVMNQAEGEEKIYTRLELGALYAAPLEKYKNMTWTTGLNMYVQDYTKSEDARKDSNTSLLFGLSRILNKNWSWSSTFTYSINVSNVEDFDYSKYILLGTLNYTWAK